MADAAMFAAVSEWIVDMLQNQLCPKVVPLQKDIKLISPMKKDTDYMVGVYLYDIREEEEAAQAQILEARRILRQQPPKPYSLYYMVFINASLKKELKEADRYHMLGCILQAVNNCNVMLPNQMQPWLLTTEPPIVLSQTQISFEEKVSICRTVNQLWQPSLFYKAATVFLSSDTKNTIPKVKEVNIGMTRKDQGEEDG